MNKKELLLLVEQVRTGAIDFKIFADAVSTFVENAEITAFYDIKIEDGNGNPITLGLYDHLSKADEVTEESMEEYLKAVEEIIENDTQIVESVVPLVMESVDDSYTDDEVSTVVDYKIKADEIYGDHANMVVEAASGTATTPIRIREVITKLASIKAIIAKYGHKTVRLDGKAAKKIRDIVSKYPELFNDTEMTLFSELDKKGYKYDEATSVMKVPKTDDADLKKDFTCYLWSKGTTKFCGFAAMEKSSDAVSVTYQVFDKTAQKHSKYYQVSMALACGYYIPATKSLLKDIEKSLSSAYKEQRKVIKESVSVYAGNINKLDLICQYYENVCTLGKIDEGDLDVYKSMIEKVNDEVLMEAKKKKDASIPETLRDLLNEEAIALKEFTDKNPDDDAEALENFKSGLSNLVKKLKKNADAENIEPAFAYLLDELGGDDLNSTYASELENAKKEAMKKEEPKDDKKSEDSSKDSDGESSEGSETPDDTSSEPEEDPASEEAPIEEKYYNAVMDAFEAFMEKVNPANADDNEDAKIISNSDYEMCSTIKFAAKELKETYVMQKKAAQTFEKRAKKDPSQQKMAEYFLKKMMETRGDVEELLTIANEIETEKAKKAAIKVVNSTLRSMR